MDAGGLDLAHALHKAGVAVVHRGNFLIGHAQQHGQVRVQPLSAEGLVGKPDTPALGRCAGGLLAGIGVHEDVTLPHSDFRKQRLGQVEIRPVLRPPAFLLRGGQRQGLRAGQVGALAFGCLEVSLEFLELGVGGGQGSLLGFQGGAGLDELFRQAGGCRTHAVNGLLLPASCGSGYTSGQKEKEQAVHGVVGAWSGTSGWTAAHWRR
ncbi:hypothetical protein SBV1_1300013 [Verrucomicrobia bacterium]|nr:hypothetical protein SBV1_1300013 [Verrucomicrobiota bacterium]